MNHTGSPPTSFPTVPLDYWTFFSVYLADFLNLQKGEMVLDVGTGWGATAIAASNKVGKQGIIFGIDARDDHLSEAEENIDKSGVSNISLRHMNVKELTFESNSFDSVICGFMGFSDTYDFRQNEYLQDNHKMQQIIRVLKQGGKAGFSTWTFQEDIEVLGDLVYDYLDKSNQSIDKKCIPIGYSKETLSGFKIMMEDAGFTKIELEETTYWLLYNDIEEWWTNMKSIGGWVLAKTLGNDPSGHERFRNKIGSGLDDYIHNMELRFSKSVVFAKGVK